MYSLVSIGILGIVVSAFLAGFLLLPGFAFNVVPEIMRGEAATTYRYKLTIELDVDGEVKRGSTVVEVRNYTVRFPEGGVRSAVTGEALYLDLGPDRRPLIALLTKRDQSEAFRAGNQYRGWSESTPTAVLANGYNETRSSQETWLAYIGRLASHRGVIEITPDQLPDLVTFTDVNDPRTVMAVDPASVGETLGATVKWRIALIEITDDPISTGLDGKLPWLGGLERYLDGQPISRVGSANLGNILSKSDFVREGF